MPKNILIVGYPYIKENYFKTFNYYPEGNKIFFLLPKIWKAKGGKLKFYPPHADNIYTVNAYFFHSDYAVIGGLFKGWMPSFPLVLFKVRKKIDIVYSSSEPILLTTLYQGFWTKFFRKKHIMFTWENIPYENKFNGPNLLLKKIIIKLNLLLSDGVVCGNYKAEDIFKRLTKKITTVIPLSGVDADFYKPVPAEDIIEEYKLKNKFIYTFAGALGYRKGVHLILEAARAVIEQIPNAHFLVIGSGEYDENLKLKVESLKLTDRVTFIPWANAGKLRKILSISKVFLYPSISYGGWEEQFGYSMAEASLMELPVISTLSGSIEDVVINGETGLLIRSNDAGELERAIIKLGLDQELRRKMGQAGRRYITENFSNKVVAEKFYEFFKKINLHS